MDKRKHWPEIDALYAIGIILVLIGHSHSSDWTKFDHTVLRSVIDFIYTFHMALFFFISGFLFWNSDSLERQGFGRWMREKALRLMTPYIILSYLAFFPKYWFEHHGFAGMTLEIVLDTILVPRSGVWGHFWFLPVLLLTYVVFGLWRHLCKNGKKGRMILLTLAVTLILFFVPINTDLFGVTDLRKMMVFFAAGIAANYTLGYKRKLQCEGAYRTGCVVLSSLISVIAFALTDVAKENSVAGLLVALSMIAACWCYTVVLPNGKIVRWLSGHNFTIYIFSWLFQSVMMAVCDYFGLNLIGTFFLMFLAGIAGPVLIVFIYNKCSFLHCRFFRLVFGIR